MLAWTRLYGVVTLECSGHCDPRVTATGELFRTSIAEVLARHGLADEADRLLAILDAELASDAR